jgi:mRNA-degrading endonuclease RelE of RelBE toxin-antitoxin system
MFQIEFADSSYGFFSKIKNKKILGEIFSVIDGLERRPLEQGKKLDEPLKGYLSISAWRKDYRIIYRIDEVKHMVVILAAGQRLPGKDSDIYVAAEFLIRNLKKVGSTEGI